jgi:hypothetical protein
LTGAAPTARKRIDFLFSVPRAGVRWHPVASRLVLDAPQAGRGVRWASDHYGVLSDFEAPSTRRNCMP